MSDPKNLWGALEFESTSRTPLQILREQAKLLGEATNGVVLGDAHMHPRKDDEIYLSVVAPVLNDFRSVVVEVKSSLVNPYPLSIKNAVSPYNDFHDCNTESEFVAELGRILSSAEVRGVISRLIQNSQA